jgi:electron transfer flavoprotein alpha/beta subunit
VTGGVLLRAVPDREAPGGEAPLLLDAPSQTAVCQAVEWRKSSGEKLTGVAVGPREWEAALRQALALGLDSAERIETAEEMPDIAATAAAIAASLPDDACLVFAGSAASDCGSGTLPAALAGVLDWPLISGVVWARQTAEGLEVEAVAGAGKRALYRFAGPAVLSAAWLGPPAVYAPLARRLAAGRAAIAVREAGAAASAAERCLLLGFGPGKPRTKRLIQPSAAARPGDRLSQLMAGGGRRAASKLSGDAEDLARQLLALLGKAGLLPG